MNQTAFADDFDARPVDRLRAGGLAVVALELVPGALAAGGAGRNPSACRA